MKSKLLLLGNYGAGNLGDEAILTALLQELGMDHSITVVSGNPEATEGEYHVPSVRFFPSGVRSFLKAVLTKQGRHALRETQKAMEAADLVVFGGGTLLTDEPRRALWIWKCQIRTALKHGKRIWIYRGGIGPLNSVASQRWVKELLNRAERIVVRDERSREWAHRLGCNAVEMKADPVLEMTLDVPQFPKKEGIVLVLRSWIKNENNLVPVLVKFVRHLVLEENKKVKAIFFEKGSKKDIQLLNTIFEQAKLEQGFEIMPFDPSLSSVIRTLSEAEHVVGMRLHSLILAERVGTPYTAIAYSEKVMGFLESVNKRGHGIPLKDLTYERLMETYKGISKDRSKS